MAEIRLDEIEAITRMALLAHGASEDAAHHVADAVREAEATGNKICGLYYLQSYCQQLQSGRVNGVVIPIVTLPRPGLVKVDAGLGFAQPAFAAGLEAAVATTRENGTASLAICHAHTCTSLGFFTGQIARAGLIGLGFTNASAIVAPPGGRTRVLGTNPIAFSVPDGKGGVAMQFDQSTTTVALGKITMANAAGEKIPEGWAVDKDGNPTTDPAAALKGSLVSMGGYKGWGFGLMAEILAAGLTGGTLSRDVVGLKTPEGKPHDLGQYYLLIDPANADGFFERLNLISEHISQDEGARMPGQGKTLADPVEVPDALWAQTQELAAYAS
ncbi:MAG: Ldh family oxidoreductase [Paracoccaceae bacterium]